MSGKLFVIEGVDGSGKATQTAKLYERLLADGLKVKKIQFPNYDSPSSSLIKMYLNGDFGTRANDVNPYVASTFYAVDRFASFKTEWQDFYKQGGILLADRYTTSNMIHQGAKLTNPSEKDCYLDWLFDFEFNLFQLPKPDCTFFLDVPPEFGERLRLKRAQDVTSNHITDIHEMDKQHLWDTYYNGQHIAQKYSWKIIHCVKDDALRTIDHINDEIYKIINQIL